MKTSLKIEIIDKMLFIIRISTIERTGGILESPHDSGLCTIERQATAYMDLGYKESMEFNKFLESNRPTMKNKWKEFADPERLKKAWWWQPYSFTQRKLFLEALKQSLIK